MKTLAQVMLFNISIIFAFTWFSGSIPQIRSAPQNFRPISGKGISPESYAAIGGSIYNGKGTCNLCHDRVGHRAPILLSSSEDGPHIVLRAVDRVAESGYKGSAKNGVEYLRESMTDPSAYVVKGFGKVGSDEAKSPMPSVVYGPMNLSPFEIEAIIAFLQNSAGMTVTAKPPERKDETAVKPVDTGVVADIDSIFRKYGCTLCHTDPVTEGNEDVADTGPSLTALPEKYINGAPGGLSLQEYIRQSVIAPETYIVKGYEKGVMPDDFADRMRVSELEMIVNKLGGTQ